MADPQALPVAVAGAAGVRFAGLPERAMPFDQAAGSIPCPCDSV